MTSELPSSGHAVQPPSATRELAASTARILPLGEVDETLRRAWQALAERAVEPNPYLEPEPVLAAAALGAAEPAPAVLLVERGADVLFALPVVRRPVLHHLPVAALVSWLHPHWGYLGTPLVDPDAPAAVWGVVLDHLRCARPAPRVVLERMGGDGPVRTALERALAERGTRPTELDPVPRAVLARRPTESYLDGRLSARHRKNLRRQRRRLAARLGAEPALVDRATPDADIAAAAAGFLSLEAAGWKGCAGTAMANTASHADHFRRMCAHFHEQGRLRLLSLAAGEVDVATACIVTAGDTAFHVKIAFDEGYAACSPGLQLELELIADFHRDAALRFIDSGSDGSDSVSAQLYPDRRTLSTLLIPLHGPHGHAASRYTPAVLAAGRRVKHVVSRLARTHETQQTRSR